MVKQEKNMCDLDSWVNKKVLPQYEKDILNKLLRKSGVKKEETKSS